MAFNFGGFGAPVPAAPAANTFGFGAPAPAPAPAFGAAFGQQPAPALGGFGGFGGAPQQQAAPAPAFGGFGAPQPQAAPALGAGFGGAFGGGFGVTPARPAAAAGFGGFGQQQPAAQAGGWGAPAPQPAVGAAYEQPDARFELPPASLSASADPSFSAIDFSPTSQFLTAGAWDGKCRVWELTRDGSGRFGAGQMRAEVDLGAPVLDVRWSRWEQNKVYAAGCGKLLKAWDIQTNQSTDVGQHTEPIACVAFAQMGTSPSIITAGWDRTLHFWDPRTPASQASVNMPERTFCMDVRDNDMVVCTAPEPAATGLASRTHIFDLRNYSAPTRSVETQLKYQSRAVRLFADAQLYALGSIEGRCRINALRAGDDKANQVGDTHPNGPRPLAFAFRCHRDGKLVYPVNAIDCFPSADPLRSPVFATAGSDGIVSLWNRRERSKIKDIAVDPSGTAPGPEGIAVKQRLPVADVKFNGDGTLLAYAASYDWSRGPENYDKAQAPYIYIKNLSADYLTVKK